MVEHYPKIILSEEKAITTSFGSTGVGARWGSVVLVIDRSRVPSTVGVVGDYF